MKKLYFLILCAAAILFAGCEKAQSPAIDSHYFDEDLWQMEAYFGTELKVPLTVIIYDNSYGGDIVYDFGDGETYTARSKEKMEHKYICEGAYTIKVVVTHDGKSKEYSKSVTINHPSKTYVTAIEYVGVTTNKYHCFQLQKKNGSSWKDIIDTEYMAVAAGDYKYVPPVQITSGSEYRVLVKGCGNSLGALHNTYINKTFKSVETLLCPDYFEYTNGSLKVRMILTYEQ